MRHAAGALVVLALTPAAALGATRHISPDGADSGPCTADAPCSVAWGINGGGSAAGDTILLAPGAYVDQPVDITRELFLRGPLEGPRAVFKTTHPGSDAIVVDRGADGSTLTRIVARATGSGATAVDVRAPASLTGLSIATADAACMTIEGAGVRLDDSRLVQREASPLTCLTSTASDTQWTGLHVLAGQSDRAALFSGDGVIDGATFVGGGTAIELDGAPTARRITARGGTRGIVLGSAAALVTDSVAETQAGGSAVSVYGGTDVLLNVTAWAFGVASDAVHVGGGASVRISDSIAHGGTTDIAVEPGSSATASHSIFRRPAPGVADGGFNLLRPPRLIDPAHQNFHPARNSPAIDHGILELQSGAADRAGLRRALGRAPDIGAYETRPRRRHGSNGPDLRPPLLAHVRLGATVFRPSRRGIGFVASVRAASLLHFYVSEPAELVGVVRRNRRGAAALGSFVARVHAGYGHVKLDGRINGRPLKPGTYLLTVIARDRAQNLSAARHVVFTIRG